MFSVVIIHVRKLFKASNNYQTSRQKKKNTTEQLSLKQGFPLLQRKLRTHIQKLLFKKTKLVKLHLLSPASQGQEVSAL